MLFRYFSGDFGGLETSLLLGAVITGLVGGLVLAILGIVFKALTWDGAIAGFYFGVIILGLGAWTWGLMYFSFFILGSVFTFVGRKRKKTISQEFEKGDTARDSIQAMVNSIVPAILALIFVLIQNPIFTVMAAGAIAVSLGDTLGTEIGSLSKKNPRVSIRPWITIEKGSPGAISLLGLLASIVGSLIIGFIGIGVGILERNLGSHDVLPSSIWLLPIAATIGGTIGAYLDSVFACTIQKLNKCVVCEKITEKSIHCQKRTEYHTGKKWMQNDVVNLFSIIAGSLIALICYLIGIWI